MRDERTDLLLNAVLAGNEFKAQIVKRVSQGYVVKLLDYDVEAFLSEQDIFGMDGQVLGEGTLLRVRIVNFFTTPDRLQINAAVGLSIEQQKTILCRVRREEKQDFDFLKEATLEQGVWLAFQPGSVTKLVRAVRDPQIPPLLKHKVEFWNRLAKAQKESSVLRGRILEIEPGRGDRRAGYQIALTHIVAAAFMPESESRLRTERIELAVGDSVEVQIIDLDVIKGQIVVSQRKVLETRLAARIELVKPYLRSGVTFRGRVVKLQSNGAIIDIGGLQGYLHVRDMSNQWIDNPATILKEGDIRTFTIKEFSESQGQIKLTFSLKLIQTESAPYGYDEYQINVINAEEEELVSSITFIDTEEYEENLDENLEINIL